MPQKLKLAVKPTFSAPVLMRVPGDGQVEEVRFNAVFKRMTKVENEDVQARLNAKTLTDKELLDQVLADWSGLDSDEGVPFICTPENRAAAVEDWPTFEAAIVYAYFEHAFPAAVKN
ncbi:MULTISPECIES: phage tail assembly chaperone [unclassified Variovorax]|uniref:phage tail assembly chaperone n=1 Tax=unclassified Variovorax TaxID=663243 RepID=UPI003F4875FD